MVLHESWSVLLVHKHGSSQPLPADARNESDGTLGPPASKETFTNTTAERRERMKNPTEMNKATNRRKRQQSYNFSPDLNNKDA
jgi:hypothetical protein